MGDQQALDVDDPAEIAAEIAGLARSTGRTVAVAESLTGGLIAAQLAAAEAASEWFRGCVVAYAADVKHELLDVADGPVVTPEAARAMASAVRRLLGADVGLGVTGVGGPSAEEGTDPGTVFVAVDDGSGGSDTGPAGHDFAGDPGDVLRATVASALRHLVERLRLPAVTSSSGVGKA